MARPTRTSARWREKERAQFQRAVAAPGQSWRKAVDAVSDLLGRKVAPASIWDYAHHTTPPDDVIDAMLLFIASGVEPAVDVGNKSDHLVQSEAQFEEIVRQFTDEPDLGKNQQLLYDSYLTRLRKGPGLSDAELEFLGDMASAIRFPNWRSTFRDP